MSAILTLAVASAICGWTLVFSVATGRWHMGSLLLFEIFLISQLPLLAYIGLPNHLLKLTGILNG